jgi:hypothetical protein
MGVLNKIKGRMTGRNALTKGPSKHHGPAHCDVDYMHSSYWNDMRTRNAPGPGKEYEFEMSKDYTKDFDIGQRQSSYTSGGDAVAAGLAAGANQPEVKYADTAGDLANIGSKLGEALGSKIALGEEKKAKELDQLQKDNPDMSRGDARKKRRANKKAKKKSKKVEDKINKGKTEGKGIYYNSSEDTFRLE